MRTDITHIRAGLVVAACAAMVCVEASASPSVEVLAEASSTQAGTAPVPFEKYSRYWSVTVGGSRNLPLGWIYFTQFHLSYYLIDNVAIEYGAMLGYVNAKRTDGGALGGPELGVRWHVAKSRRWSLYLESLVGMVLQQNPLTEQSLRFNFALQPGCGATYQLSRHTILHGGFRWHHLSNARVHGKSHNFGYDGPILYLELSRPF